ncbi:MAG: hypothetical protein JU82_10260 [Sulfuricurvum sp. MLSB]|uniref:hypothetical protein n=1 Tax=unclassified Sulfuricurvum TaxID=2632390 RepID=UPI0005033251|nr:MULTISPECIES: hypothetical protein [unclassified Sulfuricurvum]KFN38752.1 MAG: hypothetical protein JU82_10260 [Sulfuricurvum sp. MLSB]
MGKRYEKLSQDDKEFIADQHLFFIASASNCDEVTVPFVSFAKQPLNLRLFCKGELIDKNDTTIFEISDEPKLKAII